MPFHPPPGADVFSEEQPSGWILAPLGAVGCTLELRSFDPAHPAHLAHGVEHRPEWR